MMLLSLVPMAMAVTMAVTMAVAVALAPGSSQHTLWRFHQQPPPSPGRREPSLRNQHPTSPSFEQTLARTLTHLVPDPVLLMHVTRARRPALPSAAQHVNDAAAPAAAGDAASGRFPIDVSDAGAAPSARLLGVTGSHVLELTPAGDRVLFRRPLSDVSGVVLEGAQGVWQVRWLGRGHCAAYVEVGG
jgi:hypothetical protein